MCILVLVLTAPPGIQYCEFTYLNWRLVLLLQHLLAASVSDRD